MADTILKLKVNSQEYDNKLKQATNGLTRYVSECRKVGCTLEQVEKETLDYVKSVGQMDAVSKTATGKLSEMSKTFVELSAQYKNLTDLERQSPFGKALGESLDQLKVRINSSKAQLDEIKRSISDNTGGNVGGGIFNSLGSKMGGALAVFGGNLMTKAAGMAAGFVSELGDAVKQGVELAKQGEGIRIAFERLGRGDILDGLREATHGTVTDLELMKAAVKFNDFKLPVEELGTMLAFAQQKAKDTGQSVDYMVDSIVTGLGRKSLMILDNLGLSATEVKDKMKETGDMTKAVGAIIREQMAKAGDYVETAADRAAQANVSLQNKMEELGRKFAPVEEASNQLWTSMKISILDVVGGPLARLLNGLTEAGRLKNMLDDLNGGGNGKESQTEKALRILREYSGGSRGIEGKRDLYNRQVASYNKQEEKAWREANRLREELKGLRRQQKENGLAGNLQPLISETSRQLEAAENRAKAFQIIRANYQKGAAGILNPSATNTPAITNTPATTRTRTTATPKTEEQQNAARIAELVKQYQDLATAAKTADDAQKAGMTERMTKIQGEITTLQDRNAELKKFADEARQVQYPVGSLPKLNEHLKTLQTDQAKALDAKQWKDYQQQIEQTQYQIDALKGKWKDGLQATFKLNIEQQGSTDINTAKPDDIAVTFKADDTDVLAKLRDIEGVTIDDKTLTVTANTAEAYNQVEQLLKGVDGKTVTFKADDTDVLAKLRDIEGVTIDDKTLTVTANTAEAYNQVEQLLKGVDGKTVTFTVQPQMETGTSIQNDAGMSTYIASIKQQLETADYGTSLYNDLSAQLADMTTLQNLVGESLKAGLGTAMFDAADATGKDFWTRAMEGGVDNIDWQTIVDKINEARKAAGLDAIAINFKTGETKSQAKEMRKDWDKAASSIQAVGSAMSQIEDPAAKVVGTVAQAIATVALSFAQAMAKTTGPWEWVSFAVTGLATMISTISAIHSATGYANGGIVGGNSFSGDNVYGGPDAMVNSGELILNKAQQNVVAQELQGGSRMIQVHGVLRGKDIFIAAENWSKSAGKGEFVTW